MRLRLVLALILVLAAGCATDVDLAPVSGSRSDGIVNLAYDIGPFQKARVDYEEGAATARQRCQSWGYSGAQRMGGSTARCIGTNRSCGWQRVIIPYQCTGAPASR